MKLTLKVSEQSGTYEVTTNLGTIIAWERKFKAKSSTLANAIGMEDLAFMAWHSCLANGITVPAVFDDYVKRLEAIEVVSQETENPTNGEPTHED
ncbi:MAG TPA: hypothetical protein VLA24_14675 [Pseudomonadales bacterium]|nr:hypothetical protein [Pseudomonadales bacterium]